MHWRYAVEFIFAINTENEFDLVELRWFCFLVDTLDMLSGFLSPASLFSCLGDHQWQTNARLRTLTKKCYSALQLYAVRVIFAESVRI